MYLKVFQSRHSNTIFAPILLILSTLFSTYGKVLEEALQLKEANLRAKVFNIVDPLIIVFNEVDDLNELGDKSYILYTDQQVINLGIQFILI